MSTACLDRQKEEFLTRYNHSASPAEAFSRAVTAASQRNTLYAQDASRGTRRLVRAEWESQLCAMTRKYCEHTVSSSEYESDLLTLRAYMNERFRSLFRQLPHPRYRYSPGFRVSHAQKSLGVAIKHLWCLGTAYTPPQCPVDSVVLRAAGARYPSTKWAYVDSIEVHRELVSRLSRAAAARGLGLAEWEAEVFPT